ncbi:hypothetical protein QAD02_005131 [Eretmocerus hayati]|uniref:Uncharacterized protein n=1 Tax=Eretmocerus hayati TaxID=131215 RepID=A0ACC2NRJ2_9HYME|nr:hypothetical protein QAD02_005131 [Eretmocerus hayati]
MERTTERCIRGRVCPPRQNRARMRGGGGGCCGGDPGLFSTDLDFTWYNNKFSTFPTRLEGGGGADAYPALGCCATQRKPKTTTFCNKTENFQPRMNEVDPSYLAANKCRLRHTDNSDKQCTCPGKDPMESMLKSKGHNLCLKKPCLGTDCLMKAFKDAQAFVDSIGKGPGLGGLNIGESPYFGRSTQESSRDPRKAESRGLNLAKPLDTPQNSNFPGGNTGSRKVVQEGHVTLPDPSSFPPPKPKKREDRSGADKAAAEASKAQASINEESPCGEPKCKSRPRKVHTSDDNGENGDNSGQRSASPSAQKRSRSPKSSKSAPGLSKKSSKADKFVYSYGDKYPQSVYGHKDCNTRRARIPANMGWLWNKYDDIAKIARKTGWRPGAISVQMKEILNEAKAGFLKGAARRPRSAPSAKGKKGGKAQPMQPFAKKGNECPQEDEEEDVEFPPTLHIHRKDGVYYVTMYPIRQEQDGEVARLDEPINPLQFKIVKSKGSIASSSTASDMEIEFSPPAAVNRPRKRPNVVHVETQVKQQEIIDSLRTSVSSAAKKDKKDRKKSK